MDTQAVSTPSQTPTYKKALSIREEANGLMCIANSTTKRIQSMNDIIRFLQLIPQSELSQSPDKSSSAHFVVSLDLRRVYRGSLSSLMFLFISPPSCLSLSLSGSRASL